MEFSRSTENERTISTHRLIISGIHPFTIFYTDISLLRNSLQGIYWTSGLTSLRFSRSIANRKSTRKDLDVLEDIPIDSLFRGFIRTRSPTPTSRSFGTRSKEFIGLLNSLLFASHAPSRIDEGFVRISKVPKVFSSDHRKRLATAQFDRIDYLSYYNLYCDWEIFNHGRITHASRGSG